MLVVGFDTATAAVSVALHDGERVISAAFAADSRRHGELLMPMIAKVMADAGVSRGDLTAVAAGVGPGPYTGLRVGVVTARVLAAVLGVPALGVCSLDVIAASVVTRTDPVAGGGEFLVATDARRKEVYWARYDAAGARLEGPLVGAASSIPGAAELAVAGAGGQLYPEAFGEVVGPAFPDARILSELVGAELGARVRAPAPSPAARIPSELVARELGARVRAPAPSPAAALPPVPLLPAEPLYLRRPDAREPGPPKRVTPS